MVSAAGKNIPVLVSPVVVITGAAAEPAGTAITSPDAPMVMVSLLSLMMLLPACVLDCIYF
jgi:hypothetical protein